MGKAVAPADAVVAAASAARGMKAKKRLAIARSAERTRICRRCGTLTRETDFPSEEWICATCTENHVPAAMPLVRGLDWDRYDTAKVFAGFRVFRVRQGDSRTQYETEVRSPLGEIYAFAEAACALYTKSGKFANLILAEFPRARIWTRSDDGRCVIVFPVDLFPAIAKRIGARVKRVLTEEQKAFLTLRLAKARAGKDAA